MGFEGLRSNFKLPFHLRLNFPSSFLIEMLAALSYPRCVLCVPFSSSSLLSWSLHIYKSCSIGGGRAEIYTYLRMSRLWIKESKKEKQPPLVRERTRDCRLSAKIMPTFADRGYRVVSTTDPHGRIIGCLDRSRLWIFSQTAEGLCFFMRHICRQIKKKKKQILLIAFCTFHSFLEFRNVPLSQIQGRIIWLACPSTFLAAPMWPPRY
jgi:hypothetical protein